MNDVVDYPLAALHLQVISHGAWLRNPPPYLQPQIREYADRMAAGDEFPPVRLTPAGGIIDGHRRIWAAALLGRSAVKAVIVSVTGRVAAAWRCLIQHRPGVVHHTAAATTLVAAHHHLHDRDMLHAAWASFNSLPGHHWVTGTYLVILLAVALAVRIRRGRPQPGSRWRTPPPPVALLPYEAAVRLHHPPVRELMPRRGTFPGKSRRGRLWGNANATTLTKWLRTHNPFFLTVFQAAPAPAAPAPTGRHHTCAPPGPGPGHHTEPRTCPPRPHLPGSAPADPAVIPAGLPATPPPCR